MGGGSRVASLPNRPAGRDSAGILIRRPPRCSAAISASFKTGPQPRPPGRITATSITCNLPANLLGVHARVRPFCNRAVRAGQLPGRARRRRVWRAMGAGALSGCGIWWLRFRIRPRRPQPHARTPAPSAAAHWHLKFRAVNRACPGRAPPGCGWLA